MVVIADGSDSTTARQARILTTAPAERAARLALTVWDVEQVGVGIDVVVGAGRELKIATIVRNENRLRATLFTREVGQPVTSQLNALLEAAVAAGVLPSGTERETHEASSRAGAALDLDSHVGKRCVLVGDAGGFVSAFSQEGIYPAMRSGMLAAETIAHSLSAPVLQDELATFSTAWRSELAEYLRLPNTDLGLLMPMVFNNPQMSRRVARAFLLGQAF